MDRVERRKAVRMKPIPDCPATAELLEGHAHQVVILDVGAGGMALRIASAGSPFPVGTRLRLRVALSRWGEHELSCEVRYHTQEGVTGVQFVDLPPETTKAVWRYVAELLERGAPS